MTTVRQNKTKHRGLDWTRWHVTLATAAFTLVRVPKLLEVAP